MTASQLRYLAIILLTAFIMIACRGVNDNNGGGSTGELTLGFTDGPVDEADEVRIAFSGIEVTPAVGDPILIEDLEEDFVDLLDLTGGERELLLDEYDLPDGTYDTLRLIFNPTDSYIEIDGAQHALTFSPAEVILDINVFFDDDNDLEDLTIDIDLRKSIRVDNTQSPPVYELQPQLRLVETSRTETLRGTVHEDFIDDTSCTSRSNNEDGNAVYLFVGNSGPIQDIQGNDNDPFATAKVDFNFDTDQWEFAFGFLPRQTYRAAFTCDAISDDPGADNSAVIDYEGPISVDVQQNHSETINFQP